MKNNIESENTEGLLQGSNKKRFWTIAVLSLCSTLVLAAIVLNYGIKRHTAGVQSSSGKLLLCSFCGMPLGQTSGCIDGDVVISGKKYPRRLNQETRLCYACGAEQGNFHHKGCKMELCPKCGGTLLTCPCNVETIAKKTKS